MTAGTNADDEQTSVETGYEWLSERTANAITQLTSIDVGVDAAILDDDRFFLPIRRTLSQDVAQCLLSAVDHLRALVRGLQSRDKPYPYAQATLIRTAMTGASTALWIVSGSTPIERRCRAMEFMFNDLSSQLSWMTTSASEPLNQQWPAADLLAFDALRKETDRRIDWIVQEATMLLNPAAAFTRMTATAFTRKTYRNQTTTDRDMVKTAGRHTPALGGGGWNSEIVLLNSWQVLSGYAHARPWATQLGGQNVILDPTPNPTTGRIAVAAEANPHRLLDFAFRAVLVVESGIRWLNQLST